MPYRTVSAARKSLPSLKNLSDSQVKVFIKVFNSLVKEGKSESNAIPLAISQAKKKKTNKSQKELSVPDQFSQELASLITKHFGGSQEQPLQTIDKFNEEEMVAIEPLYCLPMESDLHEEGMTEDEIRKMVDNINDNIADISGNIGHFYNTQGFHFVKSWVNECECKIGDEIVLEGQPVIKVQFEDSNLWELRKQGKLGGLSIGALGQIVDNPDYEETEE